MALASQVQETLQHLSDEERLWLIEQLAHDLWASHTRLNNPEKDRLEAEMAEMAADPQIQREIWRIDREFALAEGDGLEAN